MSELNKNHYEYFKPLQFSESFGLPVVSVRTKSASYRNGLLSSLSSHISFLPYLLIFQSPLYIRKHHLRKFFYRISILLPCLSFMCWMTHTHTGSYVDLHMQYAYVYYKDGDLLLAT